MFKIFMLHTTIDKAKGTLPIDSLETESIPKADYYALGHLHIDFQYENFVYPGPTFPNNFKELEDLRCGSFYIVNTDSDEPLKKVQLNLKEIESVEVEVHDAIAATPKILAELGRRDLEDKIVLLRVRGELENGKNSDIKFSQIEEFVKDKGGYFLLKNTHDLKTKEVELDVEIKDTENIEEETINHYAQENPSDFNEEIRSLMNALAIEKQEGEKSEIFKSRLLDSTKKVLKI
jgi:DNA repair exonuclease SbcCD nuclease subunit